MCVGVVSVCVGVSVCMCETHGAKSSRDLVGRSLHDADQRGDEAELHGALAALDLSQLPEDVLGQGRHHRVWRGGGDGGFGDGEGERRRGQRCREVRGAIHLGTKQLDSEKGRRKRRRKKRRLPLLYLSRMAMVRGQILFSALVVKAGSTVQTMQRVSSTRVSTSELNWAASCTSPSSTLGRKGCSTWVLSDSFSWSQYLRHTHTHKGRHAHSQFCYLTCPHSQQ